MKKYIQLCYSYRACIILSINQLTQKESDLGCVIFIDVLISLIQFVKVYNTFSCPLINEINKYRGCLCGYELKVKIDTAHVISHGEDSSDDDDGLNSLFIYINITWPLYHAVDIKL